MKDRVKISDHIKVQIVSKNAKSGNDNCNQERQGKQSEEQDINSDTNTRNCENGMGVGKMGTGDTV